jgi:hypothetical protein
MKNNFKIYCKEKLDTTSVESLIKDYLDKLSPATYYEESNELQCTDSRSRSFYDLLSLVSYYFEGDREIELAYVLCNLLKLSLIKGIYCHDIYKNVFFSDNLHPSYGTYTYDIERDMFLNHNYNTIGVDDLSMRMIYELSKQYKV